MDKKHTLTTINKFCKSSDLSNEASVESFFVLRLLSLLGYKDSEIQTKKSIQEIRVPRGHQSERYKPDYVIITSRKPRWLIDAKSTTERIENYTYQCAGYALQINRKYDEKPLRYYMLTNGLLTRVYVWDFEEPILSLRFSDFVDGNSRFDTLKRLLGADEVRKGWQKKQQSLPTLTLTRPPMEEVKKAFRRCHRIIWKSEKMSPQAAFVEFIKVLFIKLWEDRKLRDNPALFAAIGKKEPILASHIKFSTRWIDEQETNTSNPVNEIMFRQLVNIIEHEIAQKKRKRIFDAQERLCLSPGTIKRVVKELETYFLFGIDEDLNGRMFEAFLVATMRGQDLGQYFTPRSIVKMMTHLSKLHVTGGGGRIERVIDACCGTGGFLIEALTEMRRQLWDNKSLSKSERDSLLDEVANNAIFGIDAGRDPQIARIARINMYLHGDGGSRVYMTDALRIPPEPSDADSIEVKEEVKEFQRLLDGGLLFDVALTNPPFSMDYSVNVPEEKEVLESYDLAKYEGKRRNSLRSSVMFIERYWQLLKPGGRLLTVIDDSILSGKNNAYIRNFIRERFLIRAIISLHGDAFRRAGARTKTSVLYLTKRLSTEVEEQPDAFVFESRYIGLDDVVPKTPQSVAEYNYKMAEQEIDEIEAAFNDYLSGKNGPWLVPAERLQTRLDAKFLRPWSTSELENSWQAIGVKSESLGSLVDPIESPVNLSPNTQYTFIRVTYSGRCERGEKRLGREITYSTISTARPGDIVISGLGAVYGATCVILKGMDDLLISNEFLILRPKDDVQIDPMYLWAVLRSPAVIAEWLSNASGLARHRHDWETLKKQRIPMLEYSKQIEIGNLYREADAYQLEAERMNKKATSLLSDLDLDNKVAKERLIRAKPPR